MIDIWELTNEQLDDLMDRLNERKEERDRVKEKEEQERYEINYCCSSCGKYLTCRERKKSCDKCGTYFEDGSR